MESEYNNLKIEIEDFLKVFNENKELENVVKRYYRGIQILFSPLTKNPKIMFLGINPGAGFYNNNDNVNVLRLNPMEFVEYVGQTYLLAKETRKLFELAEIPISELKQTVKSNYYFFASKNQKDLFKLLSHLRQDKVYTKSKKWINKLIEIVEPSIIVCEGKTVFNKLIKDWNCKVKTTNDDSYYYAEDGAIKIIGYKRYMSRILNKEKVAEILKKKYEELI